MMNSRHHFLAALAALPLAARAKAARAQGAPRAVTPIIVNTTITSADVLPFFYALDQKLFERAGLSVTYQAVNSGSLGLVAVVGGAANIAFANPLTIITAYAKGAPVQIVAPGCEFVPAAPIAELFVLADTPIRTAKDLEGRTVAVTGLHDLVAISIQAWAESGGADNSKVHYIEIPPSATIAALQSKRVDAAGLFEPFRSQAIGLGLRSIAAPYASLGNQFLVDAWFGHRTWIAQNRYAALRFAEVIRTAGEYANAHYDDLIPFISTYSKMSADVLKRQSRPQFPGTVTPGSIQRLIDVSARYKEIPASFRAQDVILSG